MDTAVRTKSMSMHLAPSSPSLYQCLLLSFSFKFPRCQDRQTGHELNRWRSKLYIRNSGNYASGLLIGVWSGGGWWKWILVRGIWDFRRFQILSAPVTLARNKKLSLNTIKYEKQVSSQLASWHDFHQLPEVFISSLKHTYVNVVVEIKRSISNFHLQTATVMML